jgi:hypothetical protein
LQRRGERVELLAILDAYPLAGPAGNAVPGADLDGAERADRLRRELAAVDPRGADR